MKHSPGTTGRVEGDLLVEEGTIRTRKQIAVDFLQLVVSGQIEDAYRKFVDMSGKHHNPFFSQGFDALKRAMIQNQANFPAKRIEVKTVIQERDYVVIHSHLTFNAGETGMIVIHMFRFAGKRITEFWDCGQEIPADSPNVDGAFWFRTPGVSPKTRSTRQEQAGE
ncbi:MAG TPA: ester cyclase [Bacteroidota bacterium]|nr:ester cyclase [Bacteroidota bacterium]